VKEARWERRSRGLNLAGGQRHGALRTPAALGTPRRGGSHTMVEGGLAEGGAAALLRGEGGKTAELACPHTLKFAGCGSGYSSHSFMGGR